MLTRRFSLLAAFALAIGLNTTAADQAWAFTCDSVTNPAGGSGGGDDGGLVSNLACGSNAAAIGGGGANTVVGTSAGSGSSVFNDGNSAFGANVGETVTGNRNSAFGSSTGMAVTGSFNSAFGADAGVRMTGDYNSAFGAEAGQDVTGDSNVAVGFYAGDGVTASNTVSIGTNSLASADGAIAVGLKSSATGANSTAVGPNTTVAYKNAAAFGNGATATRDNQQVFGTSSNTYTMPGLTSSASKAAQGKPTHIVTSNASGDLAAYTPSELGLATSKDISSLQNTDKKLTEGLAAVASMAQPIILPGQLFAVRAGWGGYDDASALSVSAAGVIAKDLVRDGYGTLVADAGVGVGTNEGEVAGRAGLSFGW